MNVKMVVISVNHGQQHSGVVGPLLYTEILQLRRAGTCYTRVTTQSKDIATILRCQGAQGRRACPALWDEEDLQKGPLLWEMLPSSLGWVCCAQGGLMITLSNEQ